MAKTKGSTAIQQDNSSLLDYTDRVHTNLTAVAAILDCAKVLTALERAKATETEGTLSTGEGWADGHALANKSLPDLLSHGRDLVRALDADIAGLEQAAKRSVSH